MSKPYWQKLQDPRWQKKRLQIMERDKFTCQWCMETEQTLHVHHKFYRAKQEPWEYHDACLITLCADCHELAESQKDEILWAASLLSMDDLEVTLGFLRGLIMVRSHEGTLGGYQIESVKISSHQQSNGCAAALVPESASRRKIQNWLFNLKDCKLFHSATVYDKAAI